MAELTAEWYDGANGPFQQTFREDQRATAERFALDHGGDIVEDRQVSALVDTNGRDVRGDQEVTGTTDVIESDIIANADQRGSNANEPERFGDDASGNGEGDTPTPLDARRAHERLNG